jgi:glycosyltransferase involved in cell wall biosynthesis
MISIVFATHNGAHTLRRMLDAVTRLAYPKDRFEVLVADNASTDGTRDIVLSYERVLPLTYLYCAKRGKNVALNAAIERIRGELVVLTDDDTICEPSWLTAYERCALQQPDYDIFGGTILPHWEVEPSPSLVANLPIGITYALTDPKLQAGDIYPGLVWGPNMMVRRRVFDEGLRFNESVGPSAGQYAMGSETEFTLRAAAKGHRCYFEPQAVVRHIIRAHQVEPSGSWAAPLDTAGMSGTRSSFGVPRPSAVPVRGAQVAASALRASTMHSPRSIGLRDGARTPSATTGT